ncbi:MAG: hypothetical protein LBK42_10695 [Propionibacteriaceae bacterium]|jgi:hypothetical protein|nr:hypothetical protein [Propionibacteriaceae bacterium]
MGLLDSVYSGEFLELTSADEADYEALVSFVLARLPKIVSSILPIEEEFSSYAMRNASDLGFAAILSGKSNIRALSSMWSKDMSGVVSLEEKEGGGTKSIIVKASGFFPADAAGCFIDELAKAVRPHWPNVVRGSEGSAKKTELNREPAPEFNYSLMWGSAFGLYFLTSAIVFAATTPDNRAAFPFGCLLLLFEFLMLIMLGDGRFMPFLIAVLPAILGGALIAWRSYDLRVRRRGRL